MVKYQEKGEYIWANSMKNSATFKELETFCTNILRYSLNNREDESIELEDKEPLG